MSSYKDQENVMISINNLKALIMELRKELPKILQPLNSIQEHLNQIFEIEGNYCLNLDIDEKEIFIRAIDGLIDGAGKWQEIIKEFNILITDIENWKDSIADDDGCAIDFAHSCLSDLEDIQCKLDTTEIEFDEYASYIDAVDSMLAEALNSLEEVII